MANYDTKSMTLVHEFEHRGIHVYIYKTLRGARHCSVDHEPHEKKCAACGKPIAALSVFVSVVAGKIIFDSLSANDLAENTRLFLDENDPSEPADPTDNKDGTGEPPDEPEGGSPPPTNRPQGRSGVGTLEERVEKIGWPAWMKDLANRVETENRKNRTPTRK